MPLVAKAFALNLDADQNKQISQQFAARERKKRAPREQCVGRLKLLAYEFHYTSSSALRKHFDVQKMHFGHVTLLEVDHEF